MDHAIVLFAHGSRDSEWAEPFKKIREEVESRNPSVKVELAFLELMPPSLEEAITRLADSGTDRITVFPLFLAQGGHLKRDLPRLIDDIRKRHPGIGIEVAPALGEVDAILDTIARWVCGKL
jgi:sirohydrochlorin cobaltochelatase